MIAWLLSGILTGAITGTALAVQRRSRRRSWLTYHLTPREAHLVPECDDVDHSVDDDCICGPRCEPQEHEDGSIAWLYVHHSLDGREQREGHRGSLAQ